MCQLLNCACQLTCTFFWCKLLHVKSEKLAKTLSNIHTARISSATMPKNLPGHWMHGGWCWSVRNQLRSWLSLAGLGILRSRTSCLKYVQLTESGETVAGVSTSLLPSQLLKSTQGSSTRKGPSPGAPRINRGPFLMDSDVYVAYHLSMEYAYLIDLKHSTYVIDDFHVKNIQILISTSKIARSTIMVFLRGFVHNIIEIHNNVLWGWQYFTKYSPYLV